MSQVPHNFYHMMLGLPAEVVAPDHYQLLGIAQFEDDVERIRAAAIDRNRQLMSWQNSPFHVDADHLMDQVVAAREVLFDPQRKAAYDRQLGGGAVAAPVGAPIPRTPPRIEVPAPVQPSPIPEEAEPQSLPKETSPALLAALWALIFIGVLFGCLLIGSRMFIANGRKLEDVATIPASLTSPFTEKEARAARQAWVQFLGEPSAFEHNTIGMDLILIPPGKFLMGSPDSDTNAQRHEKPQVEVTLTQPFYIGKTEVTQGQWMALMNTTPWKWQGGVKEDPNCPATCMSWDNAQEFCRNLSVIEGVTYRLPTEAEWEYACRAGTTTKYYVGDSVSTLGTYEWFGEDGGQGQYSHRVGQKRANPFGLCDMHGNVYEWCSDLFGPVLPGGTDPRGASQGIERVCRSGGWNQPAENCRSAYRHRYTPSPRLYILGFRVVRVPASTQRHATAGST